MPPISTDMAASVTTRVRLGLALGLVAVGLTASGCGDGAGAATTGAGVRHVALPAGLSDPLALELSVNTRTHALLLATDKALLEIAPGARRARWLRRSVEGFGAPVPMVDDSPAVFSGDQLVGSGHPQRAGAAPASLGLLASADGGARWTPIALPDTDLHLIRANGSRLWAYDVNSGALFFTGDHGAHWSTGRPPGPILDFAADPRDARHLLVIAEHGVIQTRDGGKTWRPSGIPGAIHLLWAPDGDLYSVDRAGTVSVSRDGGASAQPTGRLGLPPGGPLAADGKTLYAVAKGGRILRSTDHGRTWTVVLQLGG